MKKYINPQIEVIEFDMEDMIVTSFHAENEMRVKHITSSSTEEEEEKVYDDPFESTW